MEKNDLKNIVVLKNLPSNIVDEAIVILKPNSKIKKVEIIDKTKKFKQLQNEEGINKHIIKEAEMLVSKYVSKIERKEKEPKTNNIRKKYKLLKKYSIVLSIILIISIICNFI